MAGSETLTIMVVEGIVQTSLLRDITKILNVLKNQPILRALGWCIWEGIPVYKMEIVILTTSMEMVTLLST